MGSIRGPIAQQSFVVVAQETVSDSLATTMNGDSDLTSDSKDWKDSAIFRIKDCTTLVLSFSKSSTSFQGLLEVG